MGIIIKRKTESIRVFSLYWYWFYVKLNKCLFKIIRQIFLFKPLVFYEKNKMVSGLFLLRKVRVLKIFQDFLRKLAIILTI